MIFKNKGKLIDLNIGDRLKKWRLSKGLRQSQVSDKSKVLQGTLSKIEKGDVYPSIEILMKIAKAYDLDYIWLVTGVDVNKIVKDSKNE